jgi:hypothetical protein
MLIQHLDDPIQKNTECRTLFLSSPLTQSKRTPRVHLFRCPTIYEKQVFLHGTEIGEQLRMKQYKNLG